MSRCAIIGAGVAGIGCAMQLMKRGIPFTLFEQETRVGGHVHTFDFEGEEIELGVFMFDPNLTHPTFASLLQTYQTRLKKVPLDFQVSYPQCKYALYNHHPTTWNRSKALWNTPWFSNRLGLQTLLDVSAYFTKKPHAYSESFTQTFVEGHARFWWGAQSCHLPALSSRVLFDSFDNTSMQQQYVVEGGLQPFFQKLTAPFASRLALGNPVTRVEPRGEEWEVTCAGQTHRFSHVIFAVPPKQVMRLAHLTEAEKEVFGQFQEATTTVYCHQDHTFSIDERHFGHLIHDRRGYIHTICYGLLLKEYKPIFLTWGEMDVLPDKILSQACFTRVIPTQGYEKACKKMGELQGHRRQWYCGAYVHAMDQKTPSLWHENALLSGFVVARDVVRSL